MTTFTQDQLDALNAAIAGGELRVKYQDREVEYRSLNEMMRLRALMQSEINPPDGLGARRSVGVYGSGM